MSIPRSLFAVTIAASWLISACLVSVQPTNQCTPGTTFPAGDDCNTCFCTESGLIADASCTDAVCTYDPCAGLSCGDTCNPCAPDDADCIAPGAIMACDLNGACVASGLDICEPTYDPCEDKVCGDSCNICDPADKDCVSLAVETFCNDAGACVSDTTDLCESTYDPCEDKSCGDICDICPPDDADCVSPGAIMACDPNGKCVAHTADLCEGDLCKDVSCPGSIAFCDGNIAHGATGEGECDPKTGECQMPPGAPPQDCEADGLICMNGSCVDGGNVCGGIAGLECDDDQTCDIHGCGEDFTGTCVDMVDGCDEQYDPVCGCDGKTYSNDCHRVQFGGVALDHTGACETTTCEAMDAKGEGPCDAVLGYTWNGVLCEAVGGCNCVGADCDKIFETEEACWEKYDPNCICDTVIACAPGSKAIDTNGDGCEDTCEPCPAILCEQGSSPIDSNGDGCEDSCVAYDPCEGKICGDMCTLCPPNDPNCIETEEVKTCNAEGQCVGSVEPICSDTSIPLESCTLIDLPDDFFEVTAVTIEGDTLYMVVGYSGGCEEHDFSACFGSIGEDLSVNLNVGHEDNDDPCDAWPSETLAIDLLPLQKAYSAATGEFKGSLELKVTGWKQTLSYTFP